MRMNRGASTRRGLRRALHRFGMLGAGLLVALSAPAAAQYDPQGPAPLTGGGVDGMGAQSSPVTGAIEAVAPHPTVADTLLIGAVNGGIWRTTNATNALPTWTSVSDTGSIADIKYDLSDASSMTLLAGIGRTSSFGFVGSDRNGLLLSTDGGTSWSAITTLPGGPNVRAVEARGANTGTGNLVAGVNTSDAGTCATRGVFHSSNTGTSFTQRLAGATFDVTANPLTTGVSTTEIFASVDSTLDGCSATSGIHRSADSGATWTKVSTGTIDSQVVDASNVAISVGRQGGAGTDANVYVAICNSGGALTNLWRSGNSGTSWSAMTIPASAAAMPQGIHPGNQCGLHLSLQADPTNHNVVYIGGDRQPDNIEETGAGPQFPNSYGSVGYFGQLHRRDATTTLNNSLTHCTSATPASCPAQSTTGSAPHADSRDMGIDANGALIQSDDGGVYRRSTPLGVGDWAAVVGDLQINEQHDAAYDTTSNSMISGNQDNSNGYRDGSLARAPTTWTTTDSGDGGDVGVGAGDPIAGQSTRYSSAQMLLGFARRVFNSSNVLQSTAFPALTPTGGDPAMTTQFVHPIAVNAITPSRIIFGGANGIYESANRGDTISRITTDVIVQGQNFVYGTTGNADFLAYSRISPPDGAVCIRTAAAPSAPTCVQPAGIAFFPIDIVVDPGNASRLVAVNSQQIFETTNGGASWSNVTGDLLTTNAAGQIHSAEFIRNAAGTMVALVVGTRNGVFFDPDAATRAFGTYTPLSTGLGKAPVFDLQYDVADDRLLVGTLGLGAYTLDGVDAMVPVELFSFEILGASDGE